MHVNIIQMLQLIKYPEYGAKGTAVYEVPDKKENSLTLQKTMSDRQKCLLFFGT